MKEIVIIGGGMAGLSTAYWLVEAGCRVTLIDKGLVGRETSWAAAGMLAPVQEIQFTEVPLERLGQHSLQHFAEWERKLGPIGLDRSGTLEVGLVPNDVPYLQRQYEFQRAQGLEVEWCSASRLRELEPNLSAQLPGGIFSPTDCQVDNRALVLALADYLRRRGAQIIENTPVLDWREENGRMTAVTAAGDYAADALVVATGIGRVGEREHPQKVYPVKGQMLSLELPAEPLIRRVVRIRSKTYGLGYLVPKADRLVLGSTAEEMGSDARLTAGGLFEILRKAYAAVPGIHELNVLETWTGLRPTTLDRLPFVMKDPAANVFHINGLYRHGILLAPALGKAMAELVVQEREFALAAAGSPCTL